MRAQNMKKPMPARPDRSDREIRLRAYQIWEAAGRPDGRALNHWLAAEAQLRGADENGEVQPSPRSRYGLVLKP